MAGIHSNNGHSERVGEKSRICSNVSAEHIPEEKKNDVFPLQFTVKVYNTNLLFKKSPQHLTENEQNICHQQLSNI